MSRYFASTKEILSNCDPNMHEAKAKSESRARFVVDLIELLLFAVGAMGMQMARLEYPRRDSVTSECRSLVRGENFALESVC